jgi:uncharacterized protein YecT (DUF1311 family)
MNVGLVVVLSGFFAFQSSNPPANKPYSSQKQPIRSWDVFMASPEAQAAAEELHGNCGDANNQATMNACFLAEYAKADASLHKIYDLHLKQLKGSDLSSLIRVQSLWLQYREAQCKLESAQVEGGSLQPTIYFSCMQSKTAARQKEIESNYESER